MTAQRPTYVYISLSGEDRLCIFRLNPLTGALGQRRIVNVPGGPAPLAVDAEQRTLYVGRRQDRAISSYMINRADGSLTLINEAILDADPCYLSVDRSGRFLFAAYYRAGKVTVHQLDEYGAIGAQVSRVSTAPHAHCVQPDRTNRFVFVPHTMDANAIYQFQFDAESGALTPNQPAQISVAPGQGPRHYVYHPHLPRVYVSNENGNTVTVFDLNQTTGTLAVLQTLSTLPPHWQGTNTVAQIHLHPSGDFLYVSNRGHDSIAGYFVDSTTGLLSEISLCATERTPRVFGISPDGAYLLVAGQDSGRVAVYAIDADIGELDLLHTYPIGERPLWVLALTF
ncbi:MAG: lactonase family protein [Caldilineaceae bacterium]|nr:lactonase family protein [Caldilineaceae bacterium]